MIVIENKEVFSNTNKYVHRLDNNSYFKRGRVLPNDTIDLYEEVDEIPEEEPIEEQDNTQETIDSLKEQLAALEAKLNNK